jgi:hypothetical protein
MKVFNLTNASRNCGAKAAKVPSVHFNSSGAITLSKELCIALNISEKSRVAFLQSESDILDMYLAFDDDQDSFPLRAKRDTGNLIFNSSMVVDIVRLALNDSGRAIPPKVKGFSLPVSVQSIDIEGRQAFFIIPKPLFRQPKEDEQ